MHAVAIMAKAPIAGAVKSRLVPPLTFAEAAALNRAFLRDLCATIGAARTSAAANADGAEIGVAGFIAYTPAGAEAAFAGLPPADFTLFAQHGDGLTERLIQLLRDPHGAITMGEKGIAWVDREWRWDIVAGRLTEILAG